MVSRDKTIRLSKEEHKLLKKIREEIKRRGLDEVEEKLPEEVKTICPNCGERMVGAEAEYYRCPSCGYERKSATLDLGSLALGAIVGGGAAALWFLLTREE